MPYILPPIPPALIAAPCTLSGDIRAHAVSGRTVLVRLPAGYVADRKRRYPVVYLQDGQNVFDGATSFIGGQEWRADETADDLERRHAIEPVILVAIYNAGADRANEYTPTRDEKYKTGGGADAYGTWLAGTLKLFIDHTYRTRTGATDTALVGSSLGGLLALHLSLTHPDIWGKAGALSPSVWWANKSILREIDELPAKPTVRLWVDIGTKEDTSDEALAGAQTLRDTLTRKGWTSGPDFHYTEVPDAAHNEAAWAARFGDVLRFLFPPKS